MRPLAAIATLIALLLSACSNGATNGDTHVPVAPASMFMERELAFCGNIPKDKVVIGYYGASVIDTSVHLYILQQGKDTVFHDTWQSNLFLQTDEYALPDSVVSKRIHERMRSLIGYQDPAADSLACAPPAFKYAVQTRQRCVAWSAGQGKVNILFQHD
jgi:hypothetical protein